jgi:hypothetical protein
VFNEYGVQIMSPHYESDPAAPKLVPPSQWSPPPAPPARSRIRCVVTGIGVGAAAGHDSCPTYPPRGSASDVRLIEKGEPPEPYERLGQLTWDYRRSKFEPPTLQEILPELKQKAWEVGGDALVIRDLKEPRDSEGTLHVVSDVVRWKR